MKRHYLFSSVLLAILTAGCLSSCSSDDTQIPEPAPNPEAKIDSVDVTLQLEVKEEYLNGQTKRTRISSRRPTDGGLEWFYNVGDRYSVYEVGTAHKLGTVVCTNESGTCIGKIGTEEFQGTKEVYLVLDQAASDNIQWDGKIFTFKNAYGLGTYKGWIGKGMDKMKISSPTTGAQEYYQVGKGRFTLSDKKIEGYAQTAVSMAFITIPKELLSNINEIVKAKNYMQLTLKVQTDENVLESWTYDPVNLSYTFKPSSTNVREIVYDARAKELTAGEDVRFYFTLEPGTWSNPVVTLYGGTVQDGEVLGTVKIKDKYKIMEFIPADKYDENTAKSYQKPCNFVPGMGTLTKE